MKRTKEQKGITLIALIITIVVLLILASVAISTITNDGILSYAENATEKYNQAVLNEQGVMNGYEEILNKYNGGTTGQDLEFLERYFLGADKTGKSLLDIVDINTGGFLDDEKTTEVDENTAITIINNALSEDALYIRYNNKPYAIALNITTYYTESVDYVLKGREGTTVQYDSNADGKKEDWIVLTDRDGLVEIVSKDVMGSLTLGKGDTSVNITTDIDGDGTIGNDADKAIVSYNNAITRINEYCQELVTATDNDGVRSVGGTNNTFTPHHSTIYDNLASSIKVEVSTDTTGEYLINDWNNMAILGIDEVGNEYWIPKISTSEEEDNGFGRPYVVFFINSSEKAHSTSGNQIWGIENSVYGKEVTYGVRPIIINPAGI